ncbi:MAG: DNA topoisomerase IV subunit B [Pseudomonadota bacterium]|nr:DNA topoisomerase IV subunit B [Pseudomonadota bacterium]
MSQDYNAAAIEVLSGLDPVRRRPGMYTDIARPNHLAQELIDNSVDEAIAGHARQIDVVLFADGSLEVRDDGRGMPVDEHPEERVPGVELILTRLHAGGKFSDRAYRYAGGLHGVGVSVVNALSSRLDVHIRRDGRLWEMRFADGVKQSELTVVDTVRKQDTGTTVRFWPDGQFFDTAQFSVSRLKQVLRAKAVLCPGLNIRFSNEATGEQCTWMYQDGLKDYLADALASFDRLPPELFVGSTQEEVYELEWALCWLPAEGQPVAESYVNLIPTPQGGTHVNGLRSGLTDAIREFCEFRNLLPRGVKISPEDVWERISFVLSLKLKEPQFSGQTKERLASRVAAGYVSTTVKDAFSLWLNQHTDVGERLATLAVERAQARLRASKQVVRKRVATGPALPGKLADCVTSDLNHSELFLVEGDSAGGSAKQARARDTQAVMPLRGKILNTWEVAVGQVLASQEVHDISVAIGVEPGSNRLEGLRYGKICILADADSDGRHIATLLCALFLRHFRPLVAAGHVYVAMPPLYRIDVGKAVHYALDDAERDALLEQLLAEDSRRKPVVTRFKGLGEMSPAQLRETTMQPDTRRLIQLTLDEEVDDEHVLDMLLAKKRAADRRAWLQRKGNLATVSV